MPIASQMAPMVEAASMIRKMFEQGMKMKARYGEDQVYDFSLGNPDVPPPARVKETLKALLDDETLSHGYMENPGFSHVRSAVADYLNGQCDLGFTAGHILMTAGAAPALNAAFKALMDPGEEVLVPAPYFVGYKQYAFLANAVLTPVPSKPDFHMDLDAIEAAITDKTRVVLINTPNNPTGCVYTAEELAELGRRLDAASTRMGRPIYLISDEPYKKIAYDVEAPAVQSFYDQTLVVTSYSKELSLAGERMGYLAVHPKAADADKIFAAASVANTMMYVNAPALFQQVVGQLQGVTVDIEIYRKRRDRLANALMDMGYDLSLPQGAFYLFPKSPIADDIAFTDILAQHRILSVPGTGFGGPGHFRLSYAVPESVIENSLPGFEAALNIAKER